MTALLKQKVTKLMTDTADTLAFVTTADILAGEDIFIGVIKNATGLVTGGVAGITVSAGAGTYELSAVSVRSNTAEISISRFHVTTLIPAGSTVTWQAMSVGNRRAGIMQVVSGLTSAATHRSSGTAAQGVTNNVSNGTTGTTSSTETTSTTAATTIPNCLVLAVMGEQATSVLTKDPAYTVIDDIKTASGSSDRGIMMQFNIASTVGVQTATAGLSPAAVYAAAIAAYEIDQSVPATGGLTFKEWNGTSYITLTPKEWNGTSWVPLNVDEL